jgi:hypothetical protein
MGINNKTQIRLLRKEQPAAKRAQSFATKKKHPKMPGHAPASATKYNSSIDFSKPNTAPVTRIDKRVTGNPSD